MCVPEYIFDKAWREAGYLISPDPDIRKEELKRLERYADSERMDKSPETSRVVRARLEALRAHHRIMSEK